MKNKLEVKFGFDSVGEFEDFLEKVFELMGKGKIPRCSYGFNVKGRKQYDLSFPTIKE